MQILPPSVIIYLEGNVKEKVKADSYTHVASWETLKGITMVVVKVEEVKDKNEENLLLQKIKENYSKYSKVNYIAYLPYILHIQQAHNLN